MEDSGSGYRCEEQRRPDYRAFSARWQGIELEVRHCARWLCSSGDLITQHIEIRSADKVVLPITNTGYRSCFLNGDEALAEFNMDPAQYVLWWLDEAAKSKEWKAQVEAARQPSLF